MAVLGVDVGGDVHGRGRPGRRMLTTANSGGESVIAAAARAAARRASSGSPAAHQSPRSALLERKARGRIRRQCIDAYWPLRGAAYRPCAAWPEPLVPLERSHGVRGGMGPTGELEPLGLDTLPPIDADAVAVCLLHAYRDAAHEQCAEELRRRLPHAHVVASHEVAPEFGSMNVPRRPLPTLPASVVSGYLRASPRACPRRWSCVPRAVSQRRARLRIGADPRFGPAGVVGAARLAALAGMEDAIAFDMGGTSTDVSP